MRGRFWPVAAGWRPERKVLSSGLIPTVVIRSSTSPSLGDGVGSSTKRFSSYPPKARYWMAFTASSWCERRVRRSSAFEGKDRALFAPLQGVDRRGQAEPDVAGLIERHGDIHDRLVRRLYAALGPKPK